MKIFDINSSSDKLKLLIKQYEFYKANSTSTTRIISFCENSWSLTDWVFEEFKTHHNMADLGLFRDMLYEKCDHLKIMHDIANISKHSKLTRPKANIKEARKQNGPFSSAFSKEFIKDNLVVELEHGRTYNIEDLIDSVFNLWLCYFKYELKVPNETISIKLDEYFI